MTIPASYEAGRGVDARVRFRVLELKETFHEWFAGRR
jgi:hypothetical protein